MNSGVQIDFFFFFLVHWTNCSIKEKILLGSNKNIHLILDCHFEQKFEIFKNSHFLQLKLTGS